MKSKGKISIKIGRSNSTNIPKHMKVAVAPAFSKPTALVPNYAVVGGTLLALILWG